MFKSVFLFFLFGFLGHGDAGKHEFFPRLLNGVQRGTGAQCQWDSLQLQKNLKNFTLWAHQMLDSSVGSSFGVLRGNNFHNGNFKKCLETVGPFRVQYCLVTLTVDLPNQNSSITRQNSVFTKLQKTWVGNGKFGLCLPSSCSPSTIQTSLGEFLKEAYTPFSDQGVSYRATLNEDSCRRNLPSARLGAWEITFCVLNTVLVFLVVLGTVMERLSPEQRESELLKKLCVAFSAGNCWKNLFKIQENQDSTKIFHGIRATSILVVIYGHVLVITALLPWINQDQLQKLVGTKFDYFPSQMVLIVDVFFIMAGLLLVNGILPKIDTVPINPITSIFLRYWRLAPLSVYVSFVFIWIIKFINANQFLFSEDPLLKNHLQVHITACEKNWWFNALLVNNFLLSIPDTCNNITWYISCDFQLFIVGMLVMYVFQKSRRTGYALLVLLLVLSLIAPFLITLIYNIQPIFNTYGTEEFERYTKLFYIKPYNHASCYIIGMFGGIIFDKLKARPALSKIWSHLLLLISQVLVITSMNYLFFFYDGHPNFSLEVPLYNALQRPVLSIGIVCAFVAFNFGTFSGLKSFYESAIWIPLSKLSYSVYMIHMILVIIVLCSETVTNLTGMSAMKSFWKVLIISLTFAFIFHVVVENPFIKMSKAIVCHRYCQTKKQKKRTETDNARPMKLPGTETSIHL